MKKLAIILGLSSMVAVPAVAMDIPVAGQTLLLGAENDINYTTGVEEWNWALLCFEHYFSWTTFVLLRWDGEAVVMVYKRS